jgi:predicted ATPase
MQYAELIQFESLESVIEIRDANQTDRAKQLVSTYVISNEMAFRLINLVFIQLRFDALSDNKGLLIIGNYGTGKSHLMAMISAIAENADLVNHLTHPQVAQAASAIAGQFQVLRTEIGATSMSLRDLITTELTTYLNQIGVQFQFPAPDTVTNHKKAFEDMMAAFEKHYSGRGLLLVVDELLEYLRARSDQQLILDLSFLRELGEVCKDIRFRFLAGLQETIFDNQRFEFVANALRRVKDRFEQILITRQDLKFVVAKRLLKKNAEQKKQIEQYLLPFAQYYGDMNERLAEFIALFPVHPDYIDTFERISLIEKREILKTLERSVQALACHPIPETEPGLLGYDSYFPTLRENPSFRAIPDIREVIECTQALENRIEQTFTRPSYQPIAIRIIHALAVHRLTTYDINAPVGVTASELRDNLCLYLDGLQELGGNPADDLLSVVETVLKEILKTVNRQFISTNTENGQYYLDFKKNYDFDAIIEKRAETLDTHQIERHYYTALRQVMEVSDTHTAAHSFSWAYELEWRSHKVTRSGYLVFGAPSKATAALANADDGFLLYFLPIYSDISHQLPMMTSKKEVFFKLARTDDIFNRSLRYYSAAADLVSTSSGHSKSVYESKAQTYLRDVLQWLQENKPTAFDVIWQQESKRLIEWLTALKNDDFITNDEQSLFAPHPSLLVNFRDLIDMIAFQCLNPYFLELAPEYPIFPIRISEENIAQMAQETLLNISNTNRSKPAQGILSALKLLHEQQITPSRSKYAQAILQQLHQKPAGQVLNRAELFQPHYFAPTTYRLEPELVVILIAALVWAGELVLVIARQQFDASNFPALAATPIKYLRDFKHLERPNAFNLPALKALFELFELPNDLVIALTNKQEHAVQQLQIQVSETLRQLIHAQQGLTTRFICWGKPILSDAEMQHYRDGLEQTKIFLESLTAYSTPLQFKNFRYTASFVTAQWSGLKILKNISHLMALFAELSPIIAYMTAAEAILPPEHRWHTEMNQVRDWLLYQLGDVRQRNRPGFSYQAHQQLTRLQQAYSQAYLTLHQHARLSVDEAQTQQSLLRDKRLINLKKLAQIPLLPRQKLNQIEKNLKQLQVCNALSENDLISQTTCPHCGYRPQSEPQQSENTHTLLTQFDQTLEQLQRDWTQTLLTELENAAEQQELLKPESRAQIDTFLTERHLPDELSRYFLNALQESLSGLIKVTVNIEELQKILQHDGSPMTVTEMHKRFNDYLNELTKDKDVNKIRLVFE